MVDALDVRYGDGLDESHLRLLGDVASKRVIELGAGEPPNSLALASLGARVVLVDPAPPVIAAMRRAAVAAELRVECHQVELADLGFAMSASIDAVLAVGASVERYDDLGRLARQVHRVLRPGGVLVIAMRHPIRAMLDGAEVVLRRPYGSEGTRSVAEVFMSLKRANFSIDAMQEPLAMGDAGEHPVTRMVPSLLALRATKLGQ